MAVHILFHDDRKSDRANRSRWIGGAAGLHAYTLTLLFLHSAEGLLTTPQRFLVGCLHNQKVRNVERIENHFSCLRFLSSLPTAVADAVYEVTVDTSWAWWAILPVRSQLLRYVRRRKWDR